MKSIININSSTASRDIALFKNREYVMDIRINNVHLRSINRLIGFNLFSKNDLYVGGETLWTSMQPKGENEHHNYHDLTPEDIVEALRNITKPYCVLENGDNRIAIISSIMSHLGKAVNIIIEIGAELRGFKDANINKLVTLFPIGRVEEHLKNVGVEKIYYLNTGNKAK